MEPLVALSLVSNISQLIEFAGNIVSKSFQLAKAGSTSENTRLKALLNDFKVVSSRIVAECSNGHGHDGTDPCDTDSQHDVADEHALRNLAQESTKVADELASFIADLTLGDSSRKRKRDVVVGALKTTWQQKYLDRLANNFTRIQQELNLRQCYIINEKLIEVQKGIKESIRLSIASYEQSKEQLDKLRDRIGSVAEPIVQSLHYDEINYRFDTIPIAHSRTFEWVFEPSDSHNFLVWLRALMGIFWLTGKAGSGKSTLMKFLSTHKKTHKILKEWADRRTLLIASHYFFISGTTMQKSYTGLLRSLLYQILDGCPALAPIVEQCKRHKTSNAVNYRWSEDELADALVTIGKRPSCTTCFCFFIDGLDEYDGDHTAIIKTLSDLASSDFIKICASSRPWNVFRSAFECHPEKVLTLQELTHGDIELYVSASLGTDPTFRDLQSRNSEAQWLVRDITVKSQGVFLWVYLIVRSLLNGLPEGDGLEELRERVEEFPDSLDGYFRRMLDSPHKLYRKESARIFLVALYWSSSVALPPTAAEHLAKEIKDGDYAWTLPLSRTPLMDIEAKRKHLNARCRDLLEFHGTRGIGFLHRTARDFLNAEENQTILWERAGSEFILSLSVLRLMVATLKTLATDAVETSKLTSWLQDHTTARDPRLPGMQMGTAEFLRDPRLPGMQMNIAEFSQLRCGMQRCTRDIWKRISGPIAEQLRAFLTIATGPRELVYVQSSYAKVFDAGSIPPLIDKVRPICVNWIIPGQVVMLVEEACDSYLGPDRPRLYFLLVKALTTGKVNDGQDQTFIAVAQAHLAIIPAAAIQRVMSETQVAACGS